MLQLWEITWYAILHPACCTYCSTKLSYLVVQRERQRFLPFFLLCFTTVVVELVTSASGDHPLWLAHHIFSEAIKGKSRKRWYVAVENCPVHLVWGWLWTRFEWTESNFSVYCPEWQNTVCEAMESTFILFLSGGLWSFGCAQRGGWMKTHCHLESSAEKAFLTAGAESTDMFSVYRLCSCFLQSLYSSACDSPSRLTSNYLTQK